MNNMILLVVPMFLISCAHAVDGFYGGDTRITKMEAVGIMKEWCEADPWMVSMMKRMIGCRDEYMVCYLCLEAELAKAGL